MIRRAAIGAPLHRVDRSVGGGSTGLANQPPHPRWRELAELLLERGADPADEQALWINQGASLETSAAARTEAGCANHTKAAASL